MPERKISSCNGKRSGMRNYLKEISGAYLSCRRYDWSSSREEVKAGKRSNSDVLYEERDMVNSSWGNFITEQN